MEPPQPTVTCCLPPMAPGAMPSLGTTPSATTWVPLSAQAPQGQLTWQAATWRLQAQVRASVCRSVGAVCVQCVRCVQWVQCHVCCVRCVCCGAALKSRCAVCCVPCCVPPSAVWSPLGRCWCFRCRVFRLGQRPDHSGGRPHQPAGTGPRLPLQRAVPPQHPHLHTGGLLGLWGQGFGFKGGFGGPSGPLRGVQLKTFQHRVCCLPSLSTVSCE